MEIVYLSHVHAYRFDSGIDMVVGRTMIKLKMQRKVKGRLFFSFIYIYIYIYIYICVAKFY